MPIAVTCSACSASFSVKDEYAGKRAKCPKCSEPLTIPATAAPPIPATAAPPIPAAPPAAAPVVARPIVASPVVAARVPSKPTDDEGDKSAKKRRDKDEDEKPASKRRRGSDDDEEDEKPASKRRRGGDDEDEKPKRGRGKDADEDDDTSKGRRRPRDDDDEEPKKKSALPLILGIVGGVVLLCCGGPTAIWFFVIKPAGENAVNNLNAWASEVKKDQAKRDEFKNNFNQVKSGMTKKQVEDLLGATSTKPKEGDIGKVTMGLSDWPQADDRWKPKVKAGHVLQWEKSGDYVLVAFSADPNAGGTVVGAVGNIDFNTSEPVKLAAEKVGDSKNPVASLSVDDLSKQHTAYLDKWVTLKGVFNRVDQSRQGSIALVAPSGFTMTVNPPLGGLFPFSQVQPQPGETMTFTGKVGGTDKAMALDDSVFVSRTGGTAPPVIPNAALSVADVLKDAAKLNGQNVAVRGRVKLVLEHVDGDQGTIIFESEGGTHTLHAVFPPGKWRKDFVRGGEDTIDVRGILSGQLGTPGTGLHYDITTCELTRRVAKDGKEVPLPPVTPAKAPSKVTAEDLAAEFAKNPNAAAAKYTDKTITVTGTVEKLLTTGSRVTLKGLAADGPKKAFQIDVDMPLEAREEAKKLKVGDTVKLTGKFTSFRAAVGTTTPNRVSLSNGVVEK